MEQETKEDIWNKGINPKYEFVCELGTGSYGCVCQATNSLGEKVAIKKFRKIYKNYNMWRCVMREIEIVKKLSNPYIVSPIEVFSDENNDIYLVLEYMQSDLHKLARKRIFLDELQIKIIMYRILCGIDYLHSRFIIHRDLKMANILLNADCSIKICDFSLSRSILGLKPAEYDFSIWLRKNSTLNVSHQMSSSFVSINSNAFKKLSLMQSMLMDEESQYLLSNLEQNVVNKPMESSSDDTDSDNEEDLDEGISAMKDHVALKESTTEFSFNMNKSKWKELNSLKSPEAFCHFEGKIKTESELKEANIILNKKLRRIFLEKAEKLDTEDRELTGHMSTRWYRPPELILVEKIYTTALDMWSLGCIFGELLGMLEGNIPNPHHRRPLFPGSSCFPLSPELNPFDRLEGVHASAKDQLNLILSQIGSPGEADISFLNDKKARDYVKNFPKYPPVDFTQMYPATDPNALKLLSQMLKFNPYQRITAKEALRHSYFREVRHKELEAVGTPIQLHIEKAIENKVSMKDITNYIIQYVPDTLPTAQISN